MTWSASFYYVFFVFRLFYCKYTCDIYLSNLDFNGFCSASFIYKFTEDIQ